VHVLVTGGAGYIGLELCRQLLERGDTVRVVDRFFFGDAPLRELAASSGGRLAYVAGDVRELDDACRISRACRTIRPRSTTPTPTGR